MTDPAATGRKRLVALSADALPLHPAGFTDKSPGSIGKTMVTLTPTFSANRKRFVVARLTDQDGSASGSGCSIMHIVRDLPAHGALPGLHKILCARSAYRSVLGDLSKTAYLATTSDTGLVLHLTNFADRIGLCLIMDVFHLVASLALKQLEMFIKACAAIDIASITKCPVMTRLRTDAASHLRYARISSSRFSISLRETGSLEVGRSWLRLR